MTAWWRRKFIIDNVGEHSQSQTHLKVSRVILTLSHEGRGEGSEENPVQQPGGYKYKKSRWPK